MLGEVGEQRESGDSKAWNFNGREKKSCMWKRLGAVHMLRLPIGQVRVQGLDTQRNPCGKAEISRDRRGRTRSQREYTAGV